MAAIARSVLRSASASASVRNAAARVTVEAKAAPQSPFRISKHKPLSHRIFRLLTRQTALSLDSPFYLFVIFKFIYSTLKVSRGDELLRGIDAAVSHSHFFCIADFYALGVSSGLRLASSSVVVEKRGSPLTCSKWLFTKKAVEECLEVDSLISLELRSFSTCLANSFLSSGLTAKALPFMVFSGSKVSCFTLLRSFFLELVSDDEF
ncbi:hypothetical protein HHK36_001824 [Tetracentron sinense]|uniref:Uncharacterized protein n=1 Tax=Tetracentron sinense TaxID=13715 RepID=A0A834ZY65_TETSI|nr:hypothetical protein HHK36_001824 [Tetracentron sinense]